VHTDIVLKVLVLVWIVLPAYLANAAPVIFAKIYGKPRRPLDHGRFFIDGKRLLGDNKTVEGTMAAITVGFVVALVQGVVEASYFAIARGCIISLGAVVGDLLGAFIKRRLGLKPGSPAPLIDQLTFLYAALALVHITGMQRFDLTDVALLSVITLVLHLLSNVVAYMLRLKEVPW